MSAGKDSRCDVNYGLLMKVILYLLNDFIFLKFLSYSHNNCGTSF